MVLLFNFFALFLTIFLGQGIRATYLPTPTCETFDCKPNFVCKVIDGAPKCVPPPDPCSFACTLEFAPVCGSDGKTYSNKCELKRAACKEKKDITVSSEGACPTGCAAVTCLLPKVCQVINGRGQCVCSKVCPENLAPVCGSDGVTYGNECLLKYAACKNKKITLASQGPCPQTSCAAVSCIFPKVCHVINNRAQCACPSICPAVFAPVCGSDGITYSNDCKLNVAACKQNKKITAASKGPCPASSCAAVSCLLPKVCTVVDGRAQCVCPSICPVLLAPVCGSDSITYSNECELKTAVCKTGKKITVARQGACKKGCATMLCLFPRVCKVVHGHPQCACSEICTHEVQPVCRSDGRTFNNECEACSKDKTLVVISKGPCEPKITCANILCTIHHVCKMIGGHPKCINTCPKNCPEVYLPVCGSDGVSYDNECEMKHAACQKGKIINLAQKHPCGKVCFRYKCSSPPYSKCENVNSKPKCVCKFFCDTKQDLVCGSDGVTYNNVCQMEQTACKTNKDIKVASKALCKDPCLEHGPCTSPPYSRCRLFYGKPKCVCNKICTFIFAPVCGSDGKTYSSACKLEVASCTGNRKITVIGIGKCFNPCSVAKCGNYATCKVQNGKAVCVCPKACTKILKPVCGTDRQTYNNECLLKVASCKRGKEIIRVASKGRCPSYTPY